MERRGFRDLKVFQMAYALAMEIFELSKGFPKEERYALTDQVRRSSRSVVANIAEGFRKRRYPNHFALKMTECDGEVAETQVWISLACDCGYITVDQRASMTERYEEVGRMLAGMILHPEKFVPKLSNLPSDAVGTHPSA